MKRKFFPEVIIGLLIAVLLGGIFVVSRVNSQEQLDDVAVDVNEKQAVQEIVPILFNYQGRLLTADGQPVNVAEVPMTFELYKEASDGSSCWSESHTDVNAVEVEDGIFQVILGQLSDIPATCASGIAYLQLTIDDEVLEPRELLTAVATAVEAMSLPDGALVAGDLRVDGSVTASSTNNNLYLRNDDGPIRIASSQSVHVYIDSNNDTTGDAFTVSTNNDSHDPPLLQNLLRVGDNGSVDTYGNILQGGYNFYIRGDDNAHVALRGVDSERTLHLLPWGGTNYSWDKVCIGCGSPAGLRVQGSTIIGGDLTLTGTCTNTAYGADGALSSSEDCSGGNLVTAAVIEANLQTREEMTSERIDRFEQGDLLCWAGEQLELCTRANDRGVQAVANVDGRPIVMGAEPVRVTGKVELNDILVTSNIPGHAMVNNDPLPGTVIAQALENYNGESGLIKAMIRKW